MQFDPFAIRVQAETINLDDGNVYDRLLEMTRGRGPARCFSARFRLAPREQRAHDENGQTHVQRYTAPLLEKSQAGDIYINR
jgi:hypothetical protein